MEEKRGTPMELLKLKVEEARDIARDAQAGLVALAYKDLEALARDPAGLTSTLWHLASDLELALSKVQDAAFVASHIDRGVFRGR